MDKDTLYGATVTLPRVPDGRYMSILLESLMVEARALGEWCAIVRQRRAARESDRQRKACLDSRQAQAQCRVL
jgi:hypothetical protein